MHEAGHTFLARMGKTKLRPGGIDATNWLLEKAKIQPASKVLEVACNMGTTMLLVAKRYGCKVTGIDLDEAALEKARENIRANGFEKQLSVVCGSAFDLPFEDASFDVVINEAMLTMLIGEDKDRALKEYSRILKPGGVLLTHDVVFREENPQVQHELIAGLSKAINVHVEPLTLAGWKEKIEKHAFRTEQKYGAMTLLDPPGILHDEGAKGALKIMTNAMKKENRDMFTTMFDFFHDHAAQLGYVANISTRL
ncbi:class I SAM-dependent methyltransferase [Selenomonas sp.]|uniref:class I SAM-dependent methyltransferase n=1 Tax=Selenomonas sp. TaxID=2053611 RepID=UPI003FA1A7CF